MFYVVHVARIDISVVNKCGSRGISFSHARRILMNGKDRAGCKSGMESRSVFLERNFFDY